jgi:uncharacterized RmlC-like cupin family protein
MAKASTGRAAPAKVKRVAPIATLPKKAKAAPPQKAAVRAPKKRAAKSEAAQPAAPKLASARRKAAATKIVAPNKIAAKKAASVKLAAGAKSVSKGVAVKKATPRRLSTRTAVPAPAARRGRPPATAPAKKLSGSAHQVFAVNHLNEADFKADGLRTYAHYRDLGVAAATSGLCQAHVIRFVPPCTNEVRKRHVHKAELQLVYVLKGWMKNEFEGHGEQMMSAGSCWLQPSGIKHTVLDYSADCEVLEIIVPADFKTEELT